MAVLREYWLHARSFSRNAKLFLLANTLRGLGFGLNTVIFNLFLLEAGLTKGFVGTRISLISLVAVLFALPGGIISDTIGHRRSLMLATVLESASILVQIMFPSPAVIVAAVIVMGFGSTMLMVAQYPFLAENSSARERAHLFGVSFALMTLSGVLGSLLGGSLPRLFAGMFGVGTESLTAYRYTLLTGSLLASGAVIPLFLMQEMGGRSETSRLQLVRLSRPGLVGRFALPQFVMALGAGLVIPFLNVFFREYLNASSAQIGIIFSWQSVFTAVATLVAPLIAVRWGKVRSIVAVQLASLPFLLTMALSRSIWVVALASWMRTALMNMANPVLSNFTMEVIPKKERATASSITNMAWNLGWAASSQAAGYLMVRYSFRYLFFGTMGFYICAILMYWLFFHGLEAKLASVRD